MQCLPFRSLSTAPIRSCDDLDILGLEENVTLFAICGRGQILPMFSLHRDRRIGIKTDVTLSDAGKHRLQGEVVLLPNRIELVRMATCAIGGRAQERGRGLSDE